MNQSNTAQNNHNSHRLLVIDDNKGITDVISELGTEQGFEVICINEYDKVRQVYREADPDYIILDLDLGMDKDLEIAERGFDGLAIIQFLAEEGCRAKIVIVSGSEKDKRDITTKIGRELELNVVGSMGKPFRVALMEEVLSKLKKA